MRPSSGRGVTYGRGSLTWRWPTTEAAQLHIADTRDEALEAAVRRYDHLAQAHGVEQVALMTDGPNLEVDRMNARAQRLRAEQGQLGPDQVELPDLPYGLRAGDRITWTKPQSVPGQARIENGSRGNIIDVDARQRRVLVRLDGTERDVEVGENAIETLRLAYAQHLYRQQGATVQRAVSLTGGWQTTREGAYVQASRARDGTDWHISRDDLGIDGDDTDRIDRLAAAMRKPGIAVGTALSGGPPRRSQRARLTHWAPALGSGGEPRVGPGVHDAGGW